MGIRVLVVEDEANIADYLVRGLREEGFTVQHATDGVAAGNALRSGPWDLVLLDWWLPGIDGITLLRQFRERDRRTPVLFLTARHQLQYRVQGLDSGADDYLCKPFDFEELMARVRALIRRHDNSSGVVLACGDVTVDLTSQRAERAGRPLDLTAKELALLVYFLRHQGRLLSRTRIYEHVWQDRPDGLSKTLDVHIMELRRKLEVVGPRVIHTRRGQGYIFETTSDGADEEA
jgi:two-component system, OmpR family, copper resistance phosphate regulon response regulator CusR